MQVVEADGVVEGDQPVQSREAGGVEEVGERARVHQQEARGAVWACVLSAEVCHADNKSTEKTKFTRLKVM
ncbi:hypothetical protein GCM10027408_12080 [Microbacterium tumbae]